MSNVPGQPDDLRWDPFDESLKDDPHPVWKRLRDEAPIYYNDEYDFWALSRFEDIDRAHRDPQRYSSADSTVLESMTEEAQTEGMMIFLDPPEHTALRRLVSKAFTPRRVAELEHEIRTLCASLLDAQRGQNGFDYVQDFGARLPATVIAMLLGVPPADRDDVRHHIDGLFHLEPGVGMANETSMQSAFWLFEYLGQFIEERGERPRDDMLTDLVQAEIPVADGAPRRLSPQECTEFGILLVSAGTETVARLLGWAGLILPDHPEQLAALVQDPSLIPNAIEELLRYESPSPVQGRWLTEEVELHGQLVPANSKVLLLTGSAGRDERVYPEPDRFDIRRNFRLHVAFGYGIHFCLGAALARMEGKIAVLEETVKRYKSWTVDKEHSVPLHTSTVRGYQQLPIRCLAALAQEIPPPDCGASLAVVGWQHEPIRAQLDIIYVMTNVLVSDVDRIPWIVDLDAHVVEPPDVWSSRLPTHLRHAGPHIEYMPGGVPKLEGASYVEAPGTDGPDVAWWCYEDHRASVKRTIAAAGFPAEEVVLRGVTYDEMRPGCWQPAARLEDMSLNGVQAQLCFPNYPRFCGQQFLWGKDRTLALLCVEAYNDWMVEEWCGSSHGRLLPLCLIPLWDVELAVAEVARTQSAVCGAVAFSELPTFLGLPSIYSGYWDPLFRVCQETGTVICMHVGSGTKTPQTSPDAPDAVPATILFGNSIGGMSDFMFSGVLERFPELRLLFAECQIGWIPYLLERADDVWLTHRGWSNSQLYCPEPPSTYYYRQIWSCFFKDPVGMALLDRVGQRNVVFETDYPHQDGTWPHSVEAAAEQFGNQAPEIVNRLARGNAIELLGLDLPLEAPRV